VSRRASLLTPPALLVTLTLIVGACAGLGAAAPPAKKSGAVERGRYLVTIAACGDCHTPLKFGPNGPEPDMSRWLSGAPATPKMPPPAKIDQPWLMVATNAIFAGPWGISYAANLTPDSLTGIGIWSEETFIKALRTGKHYGVSRPILPPMPWRYYAQMTDEDMKSIYAYLRSLPPIRNQVPDAVVAPPPPAPGQ
jgi:mono/diheme cytochrome c family protein